MSWFILFAYIFFVYGMSVIITQGIGPKNIFFRLRAWAESVGPNFGMLFKCMLCMPTNIGIVFSLFDWFILTTIAISPFNMILGGTGLWWLAMILDGCFAGGICHLLWNIDDYIDKNTPRYETEEFIIEEDGTVRRKDD